MLDVIIQSLWFIIPAAGSNMSAFLSRKIPFLNYPVDFNKKLWGKSIFGKNKTYRGLFFGTLVGMIFAYLQYLFYPLANSWGIGFFYIIDYSVINVFLLGFLLGFGAVIGDLIESFFKRRVDIAPGKSWFPFDQLDWVVFALFLVSFYLMISWWHIIFILLFMLFLHPAINLIAYLLRLKKNKF